MWLYGENLECIFLPTIQKGNRSLKPWITSLHLNRKEQQLQGLKCHWVCDSRRLPAVSIRLGNYKQYKKGGKRFIYLFLLQKYLDDILKKKSYRNYKLVFVTQGLDAQNAKCIALLAVELQIDAVLLPQLTAPSSHRNWLEKEAYWTVVWLPCK